MINAVLKVFMIDTVKIFNGITLFYNLTHFDQNLLNIANFDVYLKGFFIQNIAFAKVVFFFQKQLNSCFFNTVHSL